MERIYPIGRLTPNLWMMHAVGQQVSTAPLIQAANDAVIFLTQKPETKTDKKAEEKN